MMLGSRAAFQIARVYAGAGFGVVIDGSLPVHPEIVPFVLEESRDLDPWPVILFARPDVTRKRIEARPRDDARFHLDGIDFHAANLERLRQTDFPITYIDTSDLTPEETVEAVLAQKPMSS
jgi:hypothetical protein